MAACCHIVALVFLCKCNDSSKPEKKFTADITYGMLASGSCLLTDVADRLHEPSKKINIVDRLSRHLEKGTPAPAAASYLQLIKNGFLPNRPYISMTVMS